LLKESISGVRGIVGDGLTPELLIAYCSAFARILPRGPIVVGRDSRGSGGAISNLVCGALRLASRDVIDIGVQATPTVEVYVDEVEAAGGIIITASHNPAEWNALKFLGRGGLFLDSKGFEQLLKAKGEKPSWSRYDGVGGYCFREDATEFHIERVLGLRFIDIDRIRSRRFRVVVDANGGTGGVALLPMLHKLNCEVIELNCIPDGNFIHGAEPIPEHLKSLGEEVRRTRADLGLATDPDADRLALVDENGEAIGEEWTLALGVAEVLNFESGPVVVNLSTSAMVEALGRPVFRMPVGEINVVMKMLEIGSPAGGEGNGGLIVPACHPGRDALLAAAVILGRLARIGVSLSESRSAFPRLHMIKTKLTSHRQIDEKLFDELVEKLAPQRTDFSDGIRLSWPERWVHIRSSNTEPIIRIIAEAPNESECRSLIGKVEAAMA